MKFISVSYRSRRTLLLCFVLFCALPTFATDDGMMQVKNDMYAFSVPKHWVPSGATEGGVLGVRTSRQYLLHYLGWNSNEDFMTKRVHLIIFSYERQDKKDFAIDDIVKEKRHIDQSVGNKIEILKDEKPDANTRKIVLRNNTYGIDAREPGKRIPVEYIEAYLYIHAHNMVHEVRLLTRAAHYNTPQAKKTIEAILASFRVK